MDPITTTILAALAGGVAAGTADVSRQAVGDAYKGLKALIQRKWGAQSELANAVANLERNPDSPGRQATLAEEVAAVQADQDAEILAAARALAEQLAAQGDQQIQEMLRSPGAEQLMRGRGGRQEQRMSDSPQAKQKME